MFIPPQVLRKHVPKKRKLGSALQSPRQPLHDPELGRGENTASDTINNAIMSSAPRTASASEERPLRASIPLGRSPVTPLTDPWGVPVECASSSTRDHVLKQANPTAQCDSPSIKKSFSEDPRVTPEYLETLVCGMELVFTNYAYQDKELSEWVNRHERTVDGEGGYIHLSALLSHDALSNLKPAPTQLLLQRAATEYPSSHLLLHKGGYFIKRSTTPPAQATNPPPSSPRTLYIEPDISTLAASPARIAWHLKSRAALKEKWKPTQAVQTQEGRPWYCFVVMNGGVEMAWGKGLDKWKKLWPEKWIVLTKAEWERRTAEYIKLRQEDEQMELRRATSEGKRKAEKQPVAHSVGKISSAKRKNRKKKMNASELQQDENLSAAVENIERSN